MGDKTQHKNFRSKGQLYDKIQLMESAIPGHFAGIVVYDLSH